MKIVISCLFGVLFVAYSIQGAESPQTPADAVRVLDKAFKAKDAKAAMALMLKLKKVKDKDTSGYLKDRIRRHIENAARGLSVEPVSTRIEMDCAVVIAKDIKSSGKFDYDPFYLIKHDGSWCVMPRLTQYNLPYVGMGDAQLKRFVELEKWYDVEADKLYKKKKKKS